MSNFRRVHTLLCSKKRKILENLLRQRNIYSLKEGNINWTYFTEYDDIYYSIVTNKHVFQINSTNINWLASKPLFEYLRWTQYILECVSQKWRALYKISVYIYEYMKQLKTLLRILNLFMFLINCKVACLNLHMHDNTLNSSRQTKGLDKFALHIRIIGHYNPLVYIY